MTTPAAYHVIQVDATDTVIVRETYPTYDAADARMAVYDTDRNQLDRRTCAYGTIAPDRATPVEWVRLYDDAPDRQAS